MTKRGVKPIIWTFLMLLSSLTMFKLFSTRQTGAITVDDLDKINQHTIDVQALPSQFLSDLYTALVNAPRRYYDRNGLFFAEVYPEILEPLAEKHYLTDLIAAAISPSRLFLVRTDQKTLTTNFETLAKGNSK